MVVFPGQTGGWAWCPGDEGREAEGQPRVICLSKRLLFKTSPAIGSNMGRKLSKVCLRKFKSS